MTMHEVNRVQFLGLKTDDAERQLANLKSKHGAVRLVFKSDPTTADDQRLIQIADEAVVRDEDNVTEKVIKTRASDPVQQIAQDKKGKFGKKVTMTKEANTPEEPVAPAARFITYVSYYFEKKNGDSGFKHVILTDVPSIRTLQQIANIIEIIKQTETEIETLEVINWMPLEG